MPIGAYSEWQVLDPATKWKQPWAIGLKTDKPFALGGIWDRWVSPNTATVLLSYRIVTTGANELLAPLHDRMPLIIAERDYQRWLKPGEPQRPPRRPVAAFRSELTKAWWIKPGVRNVQNNRPGLIDHDPSKPDELPMLF